MPVPWATCESLHHSGHAKPTLQVRNCDGLCGIFGRWLAANGVAGAIYIGYRRPRALSNRYIEAHERSPSGLVQRVSMVDCLDFSSFEIRRPVSQKYPIFKSRAAITAAIT